MAKLGKGGSGAGCLALFALPFAVVGVVAGVLLVRQVGAWLDARQWVGTPATILDVELEHHQSDDSTTYSVRASYVYEFEGRTYSGSRVWFSDKPDNVGDFFEKAYGQLYLHMNTGEPWTAFVDPESPSDAVLFRDLRWPLVMFKSVFMLLFGGVGFGLLGVIPLAKRRLAEDDRFKQLYPDEPWRWRREWRGRHIKASSRAAMVVPLVFALFWNLISWPIVILAYDDIFDPENRLALIALLFPLVGIGLAVWAVRSVIRWRRFGDSELLLSKMPVAVGGRLSGRVYCGARLEGGAAPTVRLSCYERRKRGKNSDRRLLWQDQAKVEGSQVSYDGMRTSFPVAIDLPADGQESEEHRIQWQLEVAAEVPGVDYAATFEIPVFGVETAPLPPLDPARDEPELSSSQGPLSKGIEILPDPTGGTRYVFARARQKGAALGLTLFLALWTGFLYLIWTKEAPTVFLVAFGVAELLIFLGLLDIWLTRRVAVAGPRGLTFRTGFLALGKERTVRPDEIDTLEPKSGMQAGNKLYYRILLKPKGSKNKYTIADKLDDLSVARQLVRRMKQDLGIGVG